MIVTSGALRLKGAIVYKPMKPKMMMKAPMRVVDERTYMQRSMAMSSPSNMRHRTDGKNMTSGYRKMMMGKGK